MKRILLYLIFSITYICYGQEIYAFSNKNLNRQSCNTVMYSQSTVQYSNRNNIVAYSSSNIGYSTVNIGYSTINISYQTISSSYNPESTSTTTGRPGPMKSAERPYSGDAFEDFIDWLRMNIDPNWPSYVDPDYWDEFLADYPEYEDEARNWYESHGQKFPGDPDNPFLTPIGEFPIRLLLILLFGYLFYKIYNKELKNCNVDFTF